MKRSLNTKNEAGSSCLPAVICFGGKPKYRLVRNLVGCLRSRKVPFGTSGDEHSADKVKFKKGGTTCIRKSIIK
ncbi:hypothetical protein AXF09_09600 [Ruminococcus sp. DSM 100440]|nr:hypothetical protein AXF09_09600 [Ruminococcus sp. DSM 100440]